MRTLRALMQLGGRATTLQIHALTGRLAVHTDVHSLRCMLEVEHGYSQEDTLAAVRRVDHWDGPTRVVTYVLRDDVKCLARRLLLDKRRRAATPAAVDPEPGLALPTPPPRQAALFETQDALAERQEHDRR